MLTNINWAVKIVNNGFQASLVLTCGHCKKCRNNICVYKLGLCQSHFHFSALSTEDSTANTIADDHYIAIHWYQNSNFVKCSLLSLSTCQLIFVVADVFANLRSTWRLVIPPKTKTVIPHFSSLGWRREKETTILSSTCAILSVLASRVLKIRTIEPSDLG